MAAFIPLMEAKRRRILLYKRNRLAVGRQLSGTGQFLLLMAKIMKMISNLVRIRFLCNKIEARGQGVLACSIISLIGIIDIRRLRQHQGNMMEKVGLVV